MITDSPSISPPAVITLGFVILLYGVHLVLFPFAVSTLLQKKLTRIIIIMICVTCFMFFVSSLLVATLWTATIKEATLAGIYFNQRYRAKILGWPKNMNAICADGIVVQRMFALYTADQPRAKLLRWPVGFLMAAFTILSIFNSIGEPRNGPFNTALILGSTATFLSFGINLIATSAIVYRTLNYNNHRHGSRRTEVSRTLILFIETGLFYLIWQLASAIISQMSKCDNRLSNTCTEVQFVSNTLNNCTTLIAAILPTATIAIVALRKSIKQDVHGSKASSFIQSETRLCSQCNSRIASSLFTPVKFISNHEHDPERAMRPVSVLNMTTMMPQDAIQHSLHALPIVPARASLAYPHQRTPTSPEAPHGPRLPRPSPTSSSIPRKIPPGAF